MTDFTNREIKNCALASKILNEESPRFPEVQLLQFIGEGFEGDQLVSLMKMKGILDDDVSYRSAGRYCLNICDIRYLTIMRSLLFYYTHMFRCRTCITMLDQITGDVTEIIEPSDPVTLEDVEAMLSGLKTKYSAGKKVPALALMGSMPPGCPTDLYAKIISITCDTYSKVDK